MRKPRGRRRRRLSVLPVHRGMVPLRTRGIGAPALVMRGHRRGGLPPHVSVLSHRRRRSRKRRGRWVMTSEGRRRYVVRRIERRPLLVIARAGQGIGHARRVRQREHPVLIAGRRERGIGHRRRRIRREARVGRRRGGREHDVRVRGDGVARQLGASRFVRRITAELRSAR